eukprot:CFRG1575T1
MKEKTLVSAVIEATRLSTAAQKTLMKYKSPTINGTDKEHAGDLAYFVQKEVSRGNRNFILTISEVNRYLTELSSLSSWTPDNSENAEYRDKDRTEKRSAVIILRQLLGRLSNLGVKWIIRIILQDLRLGRIEDWMVLNSYHPHFNHVYRCNRNLSYACEKLFELQTYAKKSNNLDCMFINEISLLTLNVPLAPMGCAKGRSIATCLTSMLSNKVLVETKFDGERIQVHVGRTPSIDVNAQQTLCEGPLPVEIFSRGGRRSTVERQPVIPWVLESLEGWDCNRGHDTTELGVGKDPLSSVILDGEILTYNEKEGCIEPFGHVQDIARMMRADPKAIIRHRHLIVMLFDVMYLNGQSLIGWPLERRKTLLRVLIQEKPTYVEIVKERAIVNVGSPMPTHTLRILEDEMAGCFKRREEGLVLKGLESRYTPDGKQPHGWIKLKREYIPGLGDTVDLVIFGGTFQSKPETRGTSMTSNVLGIFKRWHVGCVANKFKMAPVTIIPLFTCDAGLTVTESQRLTALNRDTCLPYDISMRQNPITPTLCTGMSACNMSSYIATHEDAYPVPRSVTESEYGCDSFLIDNRFNENIDTVFCTSPLPVSLWGMGFFYDPRQRRFSLKTPVVQKIEPGKSLQSTMSYHEFQYVAKTALAEVTESDLADFKVKLADSLHEQRKPNLRHIVPHALPSHVCPESSYETTDYDESDVSQMAVKKDRNFVDEEAGDLDGCISSNMVKPEHIPATQHSAPIVKYASVDSESLLVPSTHTSGKSEECVADRSHLTPFVEGDSQNDNTDTPPRNHLHKNNPLSIPKPLRSPIRGVKSPVFASPKSKVNDTSLYMIFNECNGQMSKNTCMFRDQCVCAKGTCICEDNCKFACKSGVAGHPSNTGGEQVWLNVQSIKGLLNQTEVLRESSSEAKEAQLSPATTSSSLHTHANTTSHSTSSHTIKDASNHDNTYVREKVQDVSSIAISRIHTSKSSMLASPTSGTIHTQQTAEIDRGCNSEWMLRQKSPRHQHGRGLIRKYSRRQTGVRKCIYQSPRTASHSQAHASSHSGYPAPSQQVKPQFTLPNTSMKSAVFPGAESHSHSNLNEDDDKNMEGLTQAPSSLYVARDTSKCFSTTDTPEPPLCKIENSGIYVADSALSERKHQCRSADMHGCQKDRDTLTFGNAGSPVQPNSYLDSQLLTRTNSNMLAPDYPTRCNLPHVRPNKDDIKIVNKHYTTAEPQTLLRHSDVHSNAIVWQSYSTLIAKKWSDNNMKQREETKLHGRSSSLILRILSQSTPQSQIETHSPVHSKANSQPTLLSPS